MEKSSKNKSISMQERIDRILRDEEFRQYCKRLKKENPNINRDIEMCEKIARINVRDLNVDKSLIYLPWHLTKEQLQTGVVDFYTYIDSLAPDGDSLVEKAKENLQYLDYQVDSGTRSSCGYHEEDGKVVKSISCNVGGRVGDITTACHEFCHSFSENFTQLRPFADKRMGEVCPVIVDLLSAHFFEQKYPQFKKNFEQHYLESQVINVIKARESWLGGTVINVMTGQTSFQDAKDKIDDMLLGNFNILHRCIQDIETYKFSGMYEKKYLVPQAIAQTMLERFKANPQATALQFKELLAHDSEWTMEQALEFLDLPDELALIDDYVKKFNARIATKTDSEQE